MNWFWKSVGILAAIVVVVVALAVGVYFTIPGAHAKPYVTMEPGDQKGNMGLYDDAYGPPFGGVPYNGAIQMPWGVCMKPAISIGVKEREGHVVDIYAEDNEVIWRCMQSHPTGEPIPADEAPIVYCMMADLQGKAGGGRPMKCYHDYRVIFNTYEHDYGKSPLIGPDEVQYVP